MANLTAMSHGPAIVLVPDTQRGEPVRRPRRMFQSIGRRTIRKWPARAIRHDRNLPFRRGVLLDAACLQTTSHGLYSPKGYGFNAGSRRRLGLGGRDRGWCRCDQASRWRSSSSSSRIPASAACQARRLSSAMYCISTRDMMGLAIVFLRDAHEVVQVVHHLHGRKAVDIHLAQGLLHRMLPWEASGLHRLIRSGSLYQLRSAVAHSRPAGLQLPEDPTQPVIRRVGPIVRFAG